MGQWAALEMMLKCFGNVLCEQTMLNHEVSLEEKRSTAATGVASSQVRDLSLVG
jgi:hypothetical protein